MSGPLRIILIVASLLSVFYCLYKIRKSKLKINYSLFWIFFSIMIFVISVFPQIPFFFSQLCGIQSPVNFVFLFMIFVLLIQNFYHTLRISKLENMIEELTEEISLQNIKSVKIDSLKERVEDDQE